MNLETVGLIVIAGIIAYAVLRGAQQKPKPAPGPVLPPNNPPVAHEPYCVDGAAVSLYPGDGVKLDLRHRVRGCDVSGASTDETGAYDPEGDILEHFVTARGPSSDGSAMVDYTIWNDSGQCIDSQWIKNGDPAGFTLGPTGAGGAIEPQAICRFIVGWTDPATPFPFTPKSCVTVPTPPGPTNKIGELAFNYRVRDTKGKEASGSRFWQVYKNFK
jgi:hypothetical protein